MDSQLRIRILVVEDNPITRMGLELFMQANHHLQLVGMVPTGEEAIEFCAQSEPDVIVMDMNLPGIDGVATTVAIKQQYPRIQVVALSSSEECRESAYEAGVSSYVLKVSPSHLLLGAIWSAYINRETQT